MIYHYDNNKVLNTDKARVRRNNKNYAIYQTAKGELIKVEHVSEGKDKVSVLSEEEAADLLSKKMFRIGKDSVNIDHVKVIAENETTKVVKTTHGRYFKYNIDSDGYPINDSFEKMSLEDIEQFVSKTFSADQIHKDECKAYEVRVVLDEESSRALQIYAHDNNLSRRTALEKIVKEKLCTYQKKLNNKNKS